MNKKQLKALLKRKEFIFTVVAYPLLFFCAKVLLKKGAWLKTYPEYYSAAALLICSLIILTFSLEFLSRIFTYRVQGDKLKLRQQEGIRISEIKEINHGD